MEPNEDQERLIKNTDGMYLVDAGAGTGKTFALTRRYVEIIGKIGVEPDDVLLTTFTNNAAEEMRKKAVNISRDYSAAELSEAPICTFHSLCNQIVKAHGFDAPQILEIEDGITSSTRIMENEILEDQEFKRFLNGFIEMNPEYDDFYRVLFDYGDLLGLIRKLASKGVFPTAGGWFSNTERYLDGDFESFKEFFEEANKPRKDGSVQSELRSRLSDFDKNCFTSDAPLKNEIRGSRCKQVKGEYFEIAFREDRERLKNFVHDIYYEYIKYALDRNYLNYNFLMMFAYVLLHEDHELRDKLRFGYVMIDEFQDTSEIQFKLALLLSRRENICAVGDWKQSIYSFQYADVDNIRLFRERLRKYKEELNEDYRRIDYPVEQVEEFPLKINYRSTEGILEFSEQSLTLEATDRENIKKDEILDEVTSLEPYRKGHGRTGIFVMKSEEEKELILWKIQEIVGNPDYSVGDGDEVEPPSYEDMVVLTRTSKFGLELQKKAREYGIPLVYEGGTEIFKTDPSIILLAWLRIMDYEHSRRGWAVVLEQAGYNFDEVKHMLETREYPDDMYAFMKDLQKFRDITSVGRRVFDRYGIDNPFAGKIVEVLADTFSSTYMNTGRIIQFIEDNIDTGYRYEVDNTPERDVVKVRTIHGEKGLEHPIVFISDINHGRFPGQGGSSWAVDYREPIGLRQAKIYREDEIPYVYDNWRVQLLQKCLSGKYDEERRLMYVAMTRAKRFLFLTSETGRSSPFFENLDAEPVEAEPELLVSERRTSTSERLEIEESPVKTPLCRPVHSIMEIEELEDGQGMDYGRRVHLFAQRYALGRDVEPRNSDERRVRNFIDDLKGVLLIERKCLLPLEKHGRKITLRGVIDLVQIVDGEVKLFDFKTDRSKDNEDEYRKQLSTYWHVLNDVFPSRDVSANIFYTFDGKKVLIDPLTKDELAGFL